MKVGTTQLFLTIATLWGTKTDAFVTPKTGIIATDSVRSLTLHSTNLDRAYRSNARDYQNSHGYGDGRGGWNSYGANGYEGSRGDMSYDNAPVSRSSYSLDRGRDNGYGYGDRGYGGQYSNRGGYSGNNEYGYANRYNNGDRYGRRYNNYNNGNEYGGRYGSNNYRNEGRMYNRNYNGGMNDYGGRNSRMGYDNGYGGGYGGGYDRNLRLEVDGLPSFHQLYEQQDYERQSRRDYGGGYSRDSYNSRDSYGPRDSYSRNSFNSRDSYSRNSYSR